MSERDLFGEPIREAPGYQSARSAPADRMFDFPVTLRGQMALQAPEGASDHTCGASCAYCASRAYAGRERWQT